MCGRYRRRSDKQRIAEAFEVGIGLDELYLDTQDDIAPGSTQPVVIENPEGERQIEMMRWGFKLPDRFLFNARSEGVQTSRFWKESFRQRRCLVPADSFYEWRKVKSGKKPKYEFEIVGRQPFGMAGIWAPWKNPKNGEIEHTFAILTGEANTVMQPIHDREPVIIEPRDYREYLARQQRPPAHLLRILPDEKLNCTLLTA
jgi:putative SOS response-associated peptidase YedK